jgi:signal transduction histidine kinase
MSPIETTESLREKLLALQRENDRLRDETTHANLLVRSLESLLRIEVDDDPFSSVFQSLHHLFNFDQALVLTEASPDQLECIVAEPAALVGLQVDSSPFLRKVMGGRVSTTFESAELASRGGEGNDCLLASHPALYLPVQVRTERAFLVLLASSAGQGFDRRDVTLARKFSLLVSHALATRHASERIRATEARAIAAEETNNMKTLFVANMSHELRTPLNAIIGFSELIAAEKLGPIGNEKYRDYAGDVRDSGKHLLNLVNNLLLFSRIEAGHHRVDVVPLRLAQEVAQAVRLLQLEADAASIHLTLRAIDENLAVMADPQGLRQIMLNVIGNAIKFSPAGSEIVISVIAGSDPRYCRLEVIDQGCGISAEVLDQLGTPFIQSEGVLSRQYQGTGLGLAISLGLARAISATLEIESDGRSGTKVTLSLPIAAA